MKQTNKDPQLDDKLTDFTDRVLAGKSARPDSTADEELRRLEKTIIRLKRALPQTESDKATLEQIESHLTARLRQETRRTTNSFWSQWLSWDWKSSQSRPHLAALAVLVMILLALVSTFMIPSGGSSVAATFFASRRVVLAAIALIGVTAALIWTHRRK